MTAQEAFDPIIPPALDKAVTAALGWINETQGKQYEITGLIDEHQALHAAVGSAYEIGLVLCDGELCKCERVVIQPTGKQFSFRLSGFSEPEVPALLDPPQGLRSRWLDEQLQKQEFLLLLFYRGRW